MTATQSFESNTRNIFEGEQMQKHPHGGIARAARKLVTADPQVLLQKLRQ